MKNYVVVYPKGEDPRDTSPTKPKKPKRSFHFLSFHGRASMHPSGVLCAKFIGALGSYSGKMGAVVFSHNRAGTYVKRFTIPVNPKTIAQISIRAIFSAVTKEWSLVTTANKIAWQALATGLSLPYGKGLYQGRNQNLSLALQVPSFTALINNVPPTPIPFNNIPMVGAATATTMTIDLSGDFAGDLIPADETVVVSAGYNSKPDSANSSQPKQIMAVLIGGADVSAPINIFTTFVNAFGTPLVGGQINYEIYGISNTNGVKSGVAAFQKKIIA